MVGDDAEEGAGRVRQPDFVTALVTTALAIGLLVINMMRGDTERATTGAMLVLVLSLALTALPYLEDR